MPRAPCRSPAAAAVARADVEVPAGAEQQQPAVVVGLAVGHREHEPGGAGVGAVRARPPVLDDALVAVAVGEVDVEAPAGGVVGRERHRQQALLAARGDLRGDVQERRAELAAVADDHDPAALLDHELDACGRRAGRSRTPARRSCRSARAARPCAPAAAAGVAVAVGLRRRLRGGRRRARRRSRRPSRRSRARARPRRPAAGRITRSRTIAIRRACHGPAARRRAGPAVQHARRDDARRPPRTGGPATRCRASGRGPSSSVEP